MMTMEEIFIFAIALVAFVITFRHIKKVVTIGEEPSSCSSCPFLQNPVSNGRQRATKDI